MFFDKLNESFDKKFSSCKNKKLHESNKHFDLLMALKRARESLMRDRVANLKAYEVAYQNVIEDYFPDKSWWEVCDLSIFNDLMEHRDPEHTEIEIIKHIKDDESLTEDTQAASVLDKYQEWVDYDMKKYHKISDITKEKLAKAGFEVVKDDHGDYEVIAKDLQEKMKGKECSSKETLIKKHPPKKIDESIKVVSEVDLSDFDFWSGAKDTVEYLTDEQLNEVQSMLEDLYPDGMTETQINDIFWFEDDWIAEMLGFESFEDLMDKQGKQR